jgi:PAS domain S-box-containing protein
MNDAAEERDVEGALRESEQQLLLALDAGKLGTWDFDLATGILHASDNCKFHFGLPEDAEFTLATLHDMVHPDDRGRRDAALAQAIASGTDYEIEYRSLWRDGTVHWISARGRVVFGRDGKPERLIGVLGDATERKRSDEELRRLNETLEERVRDRTRQLESQIDERRRAEEAMRASEARYAAVFQHTTAGIIIISVEPGGRFVYEAVNPTHEQFTGRPAADFVGVTSYDLFPRELADRLIERYSRAVETGTPLTYEDMFPYPAGPRILQATVVPIRDAQGEVTKLLISTHDLTQRKQAEEVLRQGQKMEAIGQLTGGVAHDFNNLLTAVLGNLELLGHRLSDPKSQKLLLSAAQAAERGARLTQQLLAFARKQRLEPEAVDLNHLVAGMGDILLRTIGATVRIETVLGEDLWTALVDVNQVELVLLNLAINARDAMDSGGVLTIRTENIHLVAASRTSDVLPGDYVVLSVSDTGTGMTDEVRAKAFEPFFTTKEVGKGSGLGLSQVYGIARQLGGGVELDSALGRGTAVRVFLPRAVRAVREPERTADRLQLPPRQRARILVVDDDRHVREFVVSCLEGFGYQVLEAPDGPTALDIVAHEPAIDLLLADFAMPEMNGLELMRRIRKDRPELNVLFMTGYADTADIEAESIEVPTLRKPFRVTELSEKVALALRGGPAPAVAV